MWADPKYLLRGLIKLVLVVAAASAVGVGLGAGLAKVSGDDAPSTQTIAPTAVRATTTRASEASFSTIATRASTAQDASTTTKVQGTANPDVDITVLSARLGVVSTATGHARVNVQLRVTNRASTPVQITTAVLMSGDYEVPLDYGGRDGAGAILRPIAARASATGTLRFTTTTAVTLRLLSKPTAHVRIADRTIAINLAPPPHVTTTTG